MTRIRIRHFSTRIILRTAALLFVTIVISTLFSCWYASTLFEKQVLNAYNAALENTAAHLSFLQREIQSYAGQVAGDMAIQEILHAGEGRSSHERIRDFWSMRTALTRYRAQVDYVQNIDVVTKDGSFYTTRAGVEGEVERELEQQGIGGGTASSSRFSGVYHTAEGDALLYKSDINGIIGNERNYATMYIWVHSSLFTRIIENTPAPEQQIFLMDGASQVLLSSGENPGEPNAAGALAGGGDAMDEGANFLLYNDSLPEDWTLVLSIPNEAVTNQIRIILLFFIGLGLILSLVVILVMVPILIPITRPISELSHAARKISSGDFEARVEIASGDELEILGRTFNDMTVNLKKQFQQIVYDEHVKNDLRIALLMAQINPHFIYNTLNSIIYLASMEKCGEVVSITRSFACILQQNLRTGDEAAYSTIRQEIETVRNYLVIQRLRYPGRFSLSIDAEPAADSVIVPRLLLQPLVENSIFHGILTTELPGEINLSVVMDEKRVCIRVEDNGAGMDTEQIQSLLDGERERGSPAQMNSIGIRNIRERLRLSYGDKQSFQLSAKPGGGVRVSICLPAADD